MLRRFKNATAGSTLVEVVVAITILGLVCAPICSSLVLAARVNQRSSQVMAAQLSVSNAVEQLMAEGITGPITEESENHISGNVTITAEKEDENDPYYKVVVASRTVDSVAVTTYVRATPAGETPPESGGSAG